MVWQSNSALHELCTNISLEKAVHNCKTLLGDIKRNAKRSVCPPFLFPYRKKMMFLSALPLLLVSIFTATGSKAGRYNDLGTYKRSVNTLFTLNITADNIHQRHNCTGECAKARNDAIHGIVKSSCGHCNSGFRLAIYKCVTGIFV